MGYKFEKYSTGGGGNSEGNALEGYFDGSATEITLPNVTTIKENAFREDKIIKKVNLPNATETQNFAFAYASYLEDVEMPKMEKIGINCFASCYALNINALPETLITIGQSAFSQCYALTLKEIPKNVNMVDSSAFFGCSAMTEITFKGKPATIRGCFGSSGITKINVPWASGEVSGAPWGATNATINYNYTGG